MQDRLAKALRLDGISDIKAANVWSGDFIQRYNATFSRVPCNSLNVHPPLSSNEDLALILSLCDHRKLTAKLTPQQGKRVYRLEDKPALRQGIGQSINIHTCADGRVEICANSHVIAYTVIEQPDLANVTDVDNKTIHHTSTRRRVIVLIDTINLLPPSRTVSRQQRKRLLKSAFEGPTKQTFLLC